MPRQAFEGGQLRFLSEEEVAKIHHIALRILEEVGVRAPLADALETYKKGGAKVGPDGETVKLSARMVEKALHETPSRILLGGRESQNDLLLENRKVYAGTGGAELQVLDLETQKMRPAALRDVADMARLVDALPYIDYYIRPVEPQDVPPEKVDINKYYASLANTSKHVMGNVYYVERVGDILELAGMIAGGEGDLRARPIVSFITSWMLSPLTLNSNVTRILMEIARQRMPVALSSVAILGLTSPVSMAGNLALTHAEQLSGIILAQLVSPGTPVIYGGCPGVIDMGNASFSPGSIERQILNSAISQIAQHIRVPNYNIGGITDSKLPDIQAGYEKGCGLSLTALAGSNYIHHAAGRIKDGMAYEQLVIDNEIIGMVKRALQGVKVTDETLAFREIQEVGPGGNYIAHEHTLRFFKNELFFPTLADRNERIAWERQGALDGRERARRQARKILRDHLPSKIPEGIDRELRKRFEILLPRE